MTNSQETVLSKYNSSFGKDLEDVPPHMLQEALKLALPRMQKQLVDYSMNMYTSGKAAGGSKPNALLIGFSMGLKTWSEYQSIFPSLFHCLIRLSLAAFMSRRMMFVEKRCLLRRDQASPLLLP